MPKILSLIIILFAVFAFHCSKDCATGPIGREFSISIAENEHGIVDPHGELTVGPTDSINIKARNIENGYRFLKWQITNGSNNVSVRDTAGDSTYVADIEGDAEIEAVFARDTFDIVVTSDNNGDAANEGARKIAYLDSTQITIQSARTGWEFSHWAISNNTNASIRDELAPNTWIDDITGPVTVRAIFTRVNYEFSVNQPTGGNITLENDQTPESTYPYGTTLYVKANPGRGYYLESWTDDLAGHAPDPIISITINGNTTIGANFEEIQVPVDVICVDARSTFNGDNKGTSWAKAYGDLEVADSALANDATKNSIWIAKGEYLVSRRLSAKNNSSIIGGFSGLESTTNERELSSNLTVINGQGVDRILNLYQKHEVNVDGIVFENAGAYGIYMSGSSGYGNTVANCVFRLNGKDSETCHALRINVPNVTVKNCVFRQNYGISGVAMRITKGDVKIINSIFYDNKSNAILDNNPEVQLVTGYYNCTIYSNKCDDFPIPGGISTNGNLELYGTIIHDNESMSGSHGTQIDNIYKAFDCCIQNPTEGQGIGQILEGAVISGMLSVDPSFPDSITNIDTKWFDKEANAQIILSPMENLLWEHADYINNKPSHDIRNVPRNRSGWTVGAIEKRN